MALMTGEQYIESMRKLNLQVYMFGKKVENVVDDPILRPSLNSVRPLLPVKKSTVSLTSIRAHRI